MRTLTIHSSKGGVGKTTIGVNIAASLVARGKNVCVADYDLSSPNLHTYLDYQPQKYLNESIDDSPKLREMVVKMDNYSTQGNFYACFSDPSPSSMEEMLRLTEKEATKLLIRTMKLKEILSKEYEIDYLIIDTSPGMGLTVVNSFIASDILLFIIRLSPVDIASTINMLKGFKETISKKAMVAVNLVPPGQFLERSHVKLEELTKESLQSSLGEQNIEFVGWIPTDMEYFELEFEMATKSITGKKYNMPILYSLHPQGTFSKAIDRIVSRL